jgi:hypothetical protein
MVDGTKYLRLVFKLTQDEKLCVPFVASYPEYQANHTFLVIGYYTTPDLMSKNDIKMQYHPLMEELIARLQTMKVKADLSDVIKKDKQEQAEFE